MTECEQQSPPAEQSAFAFAIRPFHHERIGHQTHLYLLSPTHTSSTYEQSTVSSPIQANAPVVERADSVHSDAPCEQRPDLTARVKPWYGVVAIMRRNQIQTMLMRCQVLQATIQSIECRPGVKNNTRTVRHYDAMKQLAYAAYSLAEGVQEPGLQARSEYWAGRACAGTEEFPAALGHLSRAELLNPYNHGSANSAQQVFALTAKEKNDLAVLLRIVTQRIETETGRDVHPLSANAHAARPLTQKEQLYIRYGSKMRRDSSWTSDPPTPKRFERAISTLSLTSASSTSSGSERLLYDEDEHALASPDWRADVRQLW